jgi:hypothetical protein
VSPVVQAFPSLHDALFAFCGFEQVPVDGSQLPTSWHWSSAVHTVGNEQVPVAGSQVWH